MERPDHKTRALILLDKILSKKYASICASHLLTIDEVLHWSLWPAVFNFIGMYKYAFSCIVILFVTVICQRLQVYGTAQL